MKSSKTSATASIWDVLQTGVPVTRGRVLDPSLEIVWGQDGLDVRATEEEFTRLREGDLHSAQLSRWTTRRRSGLLRRPKDEHWVGVELRTMNDERIRLMARWRENPERLIDLPHMQLSGAQIRAAQLIEITRAAMSAGAVLVRYNPAAVAPAEPTMLTPAPSEYTYFRSYYTGIAAQLARVNLEGHGIPVRTRDEHTVNADPAAAIAIGGVKLYVPSDRLEEAANVLDEPPRS